MGTLRFAYPTACWIGPQMLRSTIRKQAASPTAMPQSGIANPVLQGFLNQPRRIGAAHRATDEMDPEYCEWMLDFGDSGYVALHRYDGQTAVIVAVRHQREVGY